MVTSPAALFNPGGALVGMLATYTCSVFRLNKLGTPIEPVADIVPGVTPFRATLDAITVEEFLRSYSVTRHAIQNLTDVTVHRKRELQVLNVSGIISAAPAPSVTGLPLHAPTGGFRLDLLRKSMFERIADRGEPVMVITPRHSLARAWLVAMRTPWQVTDGRSTRIQLSFIEARLAQPSLVAAIKDLDSLEPGNTTTTSAGEQAGTDVNTSATNNAVDQVAPSIGGPA